MIRNHYQQNQILLENRIYLNKRNKKIRKIIEKFSSKLMTNSYKKIITKLIND